MRRCEICINGIASGVLTEYDNPHRYTFRYYPEYLAKQGEPVCLSMPLREEEYISPVLFPYFFNMLSEGENRLIQASQFHLDKEDDFGILVATAQYDTVGVVTVRPINE